MNCKKCNAPKKECNNCKKTHLECHPCYNTLIEVCDNQETPAQPIPECINPEYCSDGCDETMEAECINTRCGTLAEVIDILLDDDCNPITEMEPVCEPFGSFTTLTACTGDILDIKSQFLSTNDVDINGVISFISGPEMIINYPVTFNTPGTYNFEYKIYSPCYKAQLITVEIEECEVLLIEIVSIDCVDGNTIVQGTYTTNGSEPILNVLTNQMLSNVIIGGGLFSFEIGDVFNNQLVTITLMNEITSNPASISIDECIPCTLSVDQTPEGCLNNLSIRSQINNITDIVDVALNDDDTAFQVNYNCILDKCGVETVSPLNDLATLDTNYAVDISDFIVGTSFIDNMTVEGVNLGISTINLNPTTTSNPNLFYQSVITTWVAAIKTEIQDQLTALGVSTTDYFLTVTVINNVLSISFRVKHNPIGEWVGIGTNGTLSYGGNVISSGFLEDTYEINCRAIDDCGNIILYERLVNFSNIDFASTTFNNIVLTGAISTTTEILGSTSISYCPLEITLSANYTGPCTTPSYLWSTGATTQSIMNVSPGTYTVSVECGDCSETASFTVVPDCTLSTKITYNCATGVILFDEDWDSVSIGGTLVNSGDILNLSDGLYQVDFISAFCNNMTIEMVVNCAPKWRKTTAIVGALLCDTFILPPVLSGGQYSLEFVTSFGTSLFYSYNLNMAPGDIYEYDSTYSIQITNIANDGSIEFSIYGPQDFITEVIDINSGNNILGTTC